MQGDKLRQLAAAVSAHQHHHAAALLALAALAVHWFRVSPASSNQTPCFHLILSHARYKLGYQQARLFKVCSSYKLGYLQAMKAKS